MYKFFVITLALLSANSAFADITCVLSRGATADPYLLQITEKMDATLPSGGSHVRYVSKIEKDAVLLKNGKAIASISKDALSAEGEEGYLMVRSSSPVLSILINGRVCPEDLCPATWTQPDIQADKAPAFCEISD